MVEFTVNNKIHSATKTSLFMENYRRELRMGVDIRKKGKVKKSNRVYEKNEEDIGENRGSIKEDIREYEETSR